MKDRQTKTYRKKDEICRGKRESQNIYETDIHLIKSYSNIVRSHIDKYGKYREILIEGTFLRV